MSISIPFSTVAAANEFAAREEQFQSYLNKSEMMESGCHTSSHIGSNHGMHNTRNGPAHSLSKMENNNLVLDGRHSTNDEFVDINEMRFIHKDDGRQSNKNIIVKRLRRKKTTIRKDEECKLTWYIWVYRIL